jgi:hypothetical protein
MARYREGPNIAQRQVTPDYFQAVRTPLLRGQVFSDSDTAGSGQVVVLVSAASLACYLPARCATRTDPIVVLRFQ